MIKEPEWGPGKEAGLGNPRMFHPSFGSQPWGLGLMQFQGEAIRQEMGPLTLSHLWPKTFQEFQVPCHRVPGHREKENSKRSPLSAAHS